MTAAKFSIALLVVQFFILPAAFGQGLGTKDSLKIWFDEANDIINDNPKHALKVIQKVENACCSEDIGMQHVYLIKGKIYTQLHNYDTTDTFLKNAYDIAHKEKDGNLLLEVSHAIALNYDYGGMYSEAVEWYFKVIEQAEKAEKPNFIAAAYSNIGIIFKIEKNYEKALEIYQRAMEIDSTYQDTLGMASDYTNIATIYEIQKNYEGAANYYSKALEYSILANSLYGQALSYVNLGSVWFNMDKIDSATMAFERSIELYNEMDWEYGKGTSYRSLGSIYSRKGNFPLALQYMEKALLLIEQGDDIREKTLIYKSYATLNSKVGNWQKAFRYLDKYVELQDSLTRSEAIERISEMETKYQTEKKEQSLRLKNAEIAAEKAQNARHRIERKQQTQREYFLISGLALLALIGGYAFNRFRITRKQKRIIELQKNRVEDAYAMLEVKSQEVTDSIRYAKRIQSAILPSKRTLKEHLPNSFILYKPKDIVAGDFYWLEQKEGKVLFAACDCTGHGVPGAMVSVVCVNGLNRSVREHGLTDPGKILDKTREIVIQEFEKSDEKVQDGMDVALCALDGNTLNYAGAHNPLWIVREGSKEIEEIRADKQPIGKYDNPLPYTSHSVSVKAGDTIYIFSDGYIDQFGGEKGKKFKASNFKQLLIAIQDEPMDRQTILLDEAFDNWKGDLEQLDDVCVIGVRV